MKEGVLKLYFFINNNKSEVASVFLVGRIYHIDVARKDVPPFAAHPVGNGGPPSPGTGLGTATPDRCRPSGAAAEAAMGDSGMWRCLM